MENSVDDVRQDPDYSDIWLRYTAYLRIFMVLFVAIGAASIRGPREVGFFGLIYLLGILSGIGYLWVLDRKGRVGQRRTSIQVVVDFFVVATTVATTQGLTSNFTFIFVLVVFEAVLLIGLTQGFLIAGLASAFMLEQTIFFSMQAEESANIVELWYRVSGNCLAFFLTAFIAGFWNQNIRRLHEFQRHILDNMSTGYLITDRNGTLRALNNSGRQILGLGEEVVIGRHVADILRTETGMECPVVTALRSGRDFVSYEFRAKIGNGRSRLLGLTTNLMKDSHDDATGMIGSFTDLTEMDRLRREARRQDRMAVVGELAAGLSHEIRNPVAVIRGALEEMDSVASGEGVQNRLRAMAIRESDHLNEIVTGFLDFAREPSLKRESFDVRDVLREVTELVEREYAATDRMEVLADYCSSSCAISGDRSQIKQVFVNLAKNAIEAMAGQGRLFLSIRNGGGPIEIQLEDEGPGIAPDKVERIFEPFFTTKESGVGMGLAVCSRIVTAHDGTLGASSREGGGCSMLVRLPASQQKE